MSIDKPIPPIHQIQRANDDTWKVALTWQDGRKEGVGTFKTELEAQEWVRLHLQAWLDGAKECGK
jgi:hypothetical protein